MYEEEALAGNEFEVNITLESSAPDKGPVSIDDTVNYAEVYVLVNEIFGARKSLLESIAMEIASKLKERFQAIQAIQVQIIKLHPPITGFRGSVSVTYNKEFK